MTIAEAKKISICSYLKVNADETEVWIKSPFNPKEKTPSFKIHTIKNIWYDHARREGGTIIDLVMKLNNINASDALKHLSNNLPFSPALVLPVTQLEAKENKQIIKKIQLLQNPALLNYLSTRKINLKIAALYLKEIYYSINDNNYFSLAFESDEKGFEIRNQHFKGCIGPKTITTIKSLNPTKKVSIFEGFMDFLSALTYFKIDAFKNDVIILNTAAFSNAININDYEVVYLFLDNDEAGIKAKNTLFDKNKNCVDCSNIYQPHKDFNEFIL